MDLLLVLVAAAGGVLAFGIFPLMRVLRHDHDRRSRQQPTALRFDTARHQAPGTGDARTDRLVEIRAWFDQGRISKAEYDALRETIVSDR